MRVCIIIFICFCYNIYIYMYIYIYIWCIHHKLPSLELQTNFANYGAPPCNNQQVRIHQRKRNGNLPEIWISRLAGCILTGQGAVGSVNWEFYFVDMWLAVEHVVSGANQSNLQHLFHKVDHGWPLYIVRKSGLSNFMTSCTLWLFVT